MPIDHMPVLENIASVSVPITREVDVLVVGGGAAGCFAAISAARCGATTLLIEKNGILGGTMTVAGIGFPGLFFAWGDRIIDGPCWKSMERTVERKGAVLPIITPRPEAHYLEQIRLNKSVYACVLDDMCRESGVEVILHSMLAHVEETPLGVTALIAGRDGLFAVKAAALVDATGDANAVHMLGYPCEIGDQQQPATLTNRIDGYDFESLDLPLVEEHLQKGAEANLYGGTDAYRMLVYLRQHNLDVHTPCVAGADSVSRSALERDARRQIQALIEHLRQIPGLEQIYVRELCDECGVRETRRIVGEATVTAVDYVAARRYPDAICYAFYPVDLHVQSGIEQRFLTPGQVPTIPYGALIPRASRRVLVAGRCVSSDRYANSAIRVQAPCMAMGQAAGCAAAIMARRCVASTEVPYAELCEALRAIGAIVPEI